MSMTDPLADLFTRILNAGRRGHEKVRVPASKLKAEVLRVLKAEGFISHYRRLEENGLPILEIGLRYAPTREKQHFITGIRRISKPGCRVYVGKTDIPHVMKGLGIAILTTAKGVMTDRECREAGVGGEVLCHVW